MTTDNAFDIAGWKAEWALVTGASSGIGLEFCRQLAALGMNLAMVARDRARLEDLAGELERRHHIRAVLIPLDLTDGDASQRIKDRLDAQQIRIRLLVNNAGFGFWGRFEEGCEQYDAMIRLHALAPVHLCSTLRQDLASHAAAAVIQVCSQAAFNPIPYMNVYAATKAFQHHFSLALYEEWKSIGIRVQTLVPGPTHTNFNRRIGIEQAFGDNLDWKEASEIVAMSLRHLSQDRPEVLAASGVWLQRLFAFLAPTKSLLNKVASMFQPPRAPSRSPDRLDGVTGQRATRTGPSSDT
jgi:short-subunit dehydrogenase